MLLVSSGVDYVISTNRRGRYRRDTAAYSEAVLTLNAQVQMSPKALGGYGPRGACAGQRGKVAAEANTWRCLGPGRPNPTHRCEYAIPPGREAFIIRAKVGVRLIPTPRELSNDYGTALRFDWSLTDQVSFLLNKHKSRGCRHTSTYTELRWHELGIRARTAASNRSGQGQGTNSPSGANTPSTIFLTFSALAPAKKPF